MCNVCSSIILISSCLLNIPLHMSKFTEFSKVQQTFAQHLGSFKFKTIGEQSEDEEMISEFAG